MNLARVWTCHGLPLLALVLPLLLQAQGDLEKRLTDPDERKRRAAVEELSRQNGVESITRLLAALRDQSPMVADEAQIALGSADEAAEIAQLFTKDGLGAKSELVRLRCAEALGRVDGRPPPARIAKFLSDKDPKVRRALAASIEKLALRHELVDDATGSLRKELLPMCERDSDRGARAAALMALDALPPGLEAARLASFALDQAFEVRSAARLAASDLPVERQMDLARSGVADEHPGVRLQSARLLCVIANRDAALLLAQALQAEQNPRVAVDLVARLRKLSGLKMGREASAWLRWAQALPADWKPAAAEAAQSDDEARSATLVGLPIRSDRVTILIDLSGSMWEEHDGKPRKLVAEEQLSRALAALPPSAQFNLIPFTSAPLPWQQKLQPATPRNVAAALAYFAKLTDHGKGNFWDALQLALEDPQTDAVILLGDGAPTGGTRWNVELMRTLFEEQNRFRLVSLDAVLVDCSKALTRTWTTWCESTGGRTLSTELR